MKLRVVLGDQLSRNISALAGLEVSRDVVLMAEVMGECSYVPHHPQKIALVLSAMRHFAAALQARGVRLRYVRLDDPLNTQTLDGEIMRAVHDLQPEAVVATAPGEWRVLQAMQSWEALTGTAVDIRDDDRFLASRQFFMAWAAGKTSLRMEYFYRKMRQATGILMDGAEPVGGDWNYDSENRKKLPKDMKPPKPKRFPPDAITQEVLAMVGEKFAHHYGALAAFDYPVTSRDAQAGFKDFIAHRLTGFGDWQDAMAAGEPTMFHSLVSAPLNLGLLEPLELCKAAEAAYRAGAAPLNAVEGFIRQILGWREFVRGIYWLHMPGYASLNSLGASRELPKFYWTGETKMRCMREAIEQTMTYAYAHHIQRLMITGNFALLAGLHPDGVDQWYLAVYTDAYEWVEMPNTRGMALHADGGVVGSKPYAASGAYINRMSNYCGGCHYDVNDAVGPRGCPFNALYWDFISRHSERFANNPRMAMPVRTLAKMPPDKVSSLQARAADILKIIEHGGHGL
ncbi:MAG TPA: cryptochrome/photolyase family protein [Acidocella sp.]|nr:MAG: cryptochrome/photolyase family protein [Acidocella sp. 20-58-15]HQT39499.1 cryptochrome/photolyase family protein [Acidocella sp.]